MATTIKLKNGSGAPLAGDLVQGEPALDLTNKRLYTEDSGGSVIEVGTNPSTLTVDTDTLVVDAANNRVGIGTSSPNSTASAGPTLEISGTAGGNLVLSDSNATSGQRAKYLLSQGGALYVGHSADDGTSPVNDLVIDSSGNVASPTGGYWQLQPSASAAAPTYSFKGDTDSGMYRPAGNANTVAFSTAGAERMRIDSTGNVGIGTTSTTFRFNVSSASSTTTNLQSTSATSNLRLTNSGGLATIGSTSNELHFTTSTTERMRIDSNGQIMIQGSATAFDTTAAKNGLQAYYETDTGIATLGSYSSGGSTLMTFRTNSGGGASAERMRIDSSGNVSIGSTDDNPFGFSGSSNNVSITASGANDFALLSLKGNGTGGTAISLGSGSVRHAGIFSLNGSSLAFYTNSTNTGSNTTERMHITSSGNVGIGTANPNYLLHINKSDSAGCWTQFTNSTTGTGGSAGALVGIDSDEDFRILQYEAKAIKLYTSTTERMRIAANGNVGIGTTSPLRALQIGDHSGAQQALSIQASTTGKSDIFLGDGTGSGEYAGLVRYDHASDFMALWTASTERMRIDSSGNLLVGTSSLVGNSGRFQAVRSNTGAIGYFEVNNGGGAQNAVDITNAANAAFVPLRFWVNGYGSSLVGSISCTTSATTYNTSSDQRLKENIVDAPAGNIDAIRVRSFDWKADGSHQTYGMVAQELVDVAPEAVSQGETEDDMWGVDYSKLVPMMIKEIQDLKAEVAALKGE